jgi:hypothetical protein
MDIGEWMDELEMETLIHVEDEYRSKTGVFEMSNRKPFNDCAGYVASLKNPLTGIHNVIYIAAKQGIDAAQKYATVCEAHHTMVSASSIPNARIDMKDASKWCADCQALKENYRRETDVEPSWLTDKFEGDE